MLEVPGQRPLARGHYESVLGLDTSIPAMPVDEIGCTLEEQKLSSQGFCDTDRLNQIPARRAKVGEAEKVNFGNVAVRWVLFAKAWVVDDDVSVVMVVVLERAFHLVE